MDRVDTMSVVSSFLEGIMTGSTVRYEARSIVAMMHSWPEVKRMVWTLESKQDTAKNTEKAKEMRLLMVRREKESKPKRPIRNE